MVSPEMPQRDQGFKVIKRPPIVTIGSRLTVSKKGNIEPYVIGIPEVRRYCRMMEDSLRSVIAETFVSEAYDYAGSQGKNLEGIRMVARDYEGI